MKKNLLTFAFFISSMVVLNAQNTIDSLSYENTQDIAVFKDIKNRTLVNKYRTINNNVIQVGDTVVLGTPTSEELNSKTYTGSYGNRARGGVSTTRSTTKKTYEYIKLGRPSGFGSVMASLSDEQQPMADITLKNTNTIVEEIRAYHRGSKKKPLYLVMVLGEINGRAFGFNKYLSVMDTELAIESSEIVLKNRKMTRDEAILKLKEAKELLDIQMLSEEDFEKLKKELGPIIMGEQ